MPIGDLLGGDVALSQTEVAAGLREALRFGAERGVVRAGRRGGFAQDPLLRIEMPAGLSGPARALRNAGMGWAVDALEDSMNRAAEQAAAEAAPVFAEAIQSLTLGKALQILRGPNDAATRHLRETTGQALRERFTPIVRASMQEVGVARIYRDLSARLRTLALLEDPNFELEHYVVGQTLDGLYTVLAQEERRIREEPAARTTELLRRVFSAQ